MRCWGAEPCQEPRPGNPETMTAEPAIAIAVEHLTPCGLHGRFQGLHDRLLVHDASRLVREEGRVGVQRPSAQGTKLLKLSHGGVEWTWLI